MQGSQGRKRPGPFVDSDSEDEHMGKSNIEQIKRFSGKEGVIKKNEDFWPAQDSTISSVMKDELGAQSDDELHKESYISGIRSKDKDVLTAKIYNNRSLPIEKQKEDLGWAGSLQLGNNLQRGSSLLKAKQVKASSTPEAQVESSRVTIDASNPVKRVRFGKAEIMNIPERSRFDSYGRSPGISRPIQQNLLTTNKIGAHDIGQTDPVNHIVGNVGTLSHTQSLSARLPEVERLSPQAVSTVNPKAPLDSRQYGNALNHIEITNVSLKANETQTKKSRPSISIKRRVDADNIDDFQISSHNIAGTSSMNKGHTSSKQYREDFGHNLASSFKMGSRCSFNGSISAQTLSHDPMTSVYKSKSNKLLSKGLNLDHNDLFMEEICDDYAQAEQRPSNNSDPFRAPQRSVSDAPLHDDGNFFSEQMSDDRGGVRERLMNDDLSHKYDDLFGEEALDDLDRSRQKFENDDLANEIRASFLFQKYATKRNIFEYDNIMGCMDDQTRLPEVETGHGYTKRDEAFFIEQGMSLADARKLNTARPIGKSTFRQQALGKVDEASNLKFSKQGLGTQSKSQGTSQGRSNFMPSYDPVELPTMMKNSYNNSNPGLGGVAAKDKRQGAWEKRAGGWSETEAQRQKSFDSKVGTSLLMSNASPPTSTPMKSQTRPMTPPGVSVPDPDEPGSGEAPARRKYKGSGRITASCKTCRKEHQRCDEMMPECLRCTRYGRYCEWYGDEAFDYLSYTLKTGERTHIMMTMDDADVTFIDYTQKVREMDRYTRGLQEENQDLRRKIGDKI
ncbi:hypothetical protein B0O99DRAFT_712734 [Bisporella sp. PMI_857]|nr:hypothetical protein B0O99DRAFT_712734 [Bisporella sp. PMI_857]